ncbi:MAG: helix-turn-helix domain-containing protein [Methanobacteriaceae archaeon]
MMEQNRDIGARIKELREIYEFTELELAKELDVTVDEYQAFEKGEKFVPPSLLHEIAVKFDVDIGLLITGEESKLNIFTVTRKGEGTIVNRRQQYIYENLGTNFIHKKVEPFVVTVDPIEEVDKPKQHAHPGQEFNYVLEGSIRFYIHDNEIDLHVGDSIFFDSKYKHAMKALNQERAKFIAIII